MGSEGVICRSVLHAIGEMAQVKTLAINHCYLDVSRHAVRQSQAIKHDFDVMHSK